MSQYIHQSERLGFRAWKSTDLAPYAEMCADERVMEFFPAGQTEAHCRQAITRFNDDIEKKGFAYFAAETLAEQEFIGFIGIMEQDYSPLYAPFVDIGWRLKVAAWNKGYATEGARACLQFGFEQQHLPTIYSVAPSLNLKSQRIMQKIGMTQIDRFMHPKIDQSDPTCECTLWKINRPKK